MTSRILSLSRLCLVVAVLMFGGYSPSAVAGPSTPPSAPDFSGWHLPLPAGEWQISRGPCGADTLFDHLCGYYENQCALDFVPISGSLENVPVLAPQAGQAFFIGAREETGRMLMLLHPDGRVSVLFHLARIVVGLDEAVQQGQVVAYAGGSGNVRPHLHFFVQRNAVERECLNVQGLDTVNYRDARAVSRNLAWSQLELIDPPATLPDFLPTLATAPTEGIILPQQVRLGPGERVSLPVLVNGQLTATDSLTTGGNLLAAIRRSTTQTWFTVPLTAPQRAGEYSVRLELRAADARLNRQAAVMRYTVRPWAGTRAGPGFLFTNPEMTNPTGWTFHDAPPLLCWRVPANVGKAPLSFRAIAVGPTQVDSGWISATCWQAPKLDPGTYFWKVFVRDAGGVMNRTNQRPFAFVMR